MRLYLRVYEQADTVQIFDKEEYLLWVVGVVVFLNVELVPFVHGQEVVWVHTCRAYVCEFQEITSPFKVIWSNVTVIPI